MLEHTKGQGNLIFGKSAIWVCERDKGLTDEFYSFIKTVHYLQQFKGIQSSKQGMWKGYHLSIEGILKWYLFREKWYRKKRVRGWTLGRSLSAEKFIEYPPDKRCLKR